MRQIVETFNIYKFEELTEELKNKVLTKYWNINVNYDWYQYTYEDMDTVALSCDGFDTDRGNYCTLEFKINGLETARLIIEHHGESCETFKLAKEFQNAVDGMDEGSKEFEDAERDFLKDLSEEYLSMLRREYEYLTSEEAISETLIANEYEFTDNGSIY